MQNLEEKVKALNKMLFDMGSGSSLPILRDPVEKIDYLGRQLKDLQGLLKTTRKNHAQIIKDVVANRVSLALVKLKAFDPSIHLQAIEEEATKLFKKVMPLKNKVAEETEIGSPSHSDQSGGSEK